MKQLVAVGLMCVIACGGSSKPPAEQPTLANKPAEEAPPPTPPTEAAPPPADAAPAGQALPPALVAALIDLIADALPPPLAAAALADAPIVWGDAGLAAARDVGAQVIVHVGLWHHLAPHGLARVALGLAEALTPIAAARAVVALTR